MTDGKTYSHPPLIEVAFEISFLPKIKVFSQISEFQDKIADAFPIIGEGLPVTPFGKNEEIDKSLGRMLLFENELRTKLLRIKINSFNFVEKKYISFNHFQTECLDLWDKFCTNIGTFAVRRIGLRYINTLTFPLTDNIEGIKLFTKPYFDIKAFTEDKIGSISIEARVKRKDKNLTIRSGIIGVNKETGLMDYLLDYDCYQIGDKIFDGDLKKYIDNYHSTIEEQFLSDIEEIYLIYMETGEWK